MYFHAKQMLEKTRQEKHGSHPSILSRWCADAANRKSLSDIEWREHYVMLYDRVALEKPIYKATRAERIQIANNWILTASSEGGTQLPLNQQPDFAQAKRECKRLHDEHLTRTNKNTEIFLAVTKEDSEKGNNFEGYEDFAYVVDPNKGWRFYRQSRGNCRHLRQARRPTCKQLRHRHRRGTKPSGRRTIGILSILQVLTSADFSS